MAGVQRSGIDRCVMRVLKGQKMKLKYRRHGYRYAHDLPGEWEAEDELEEMAEAAAQDSPPEERAVASSSSNGSKNDAPFSGVASAAALLSRCCAAAVLTPLATALPAIAASLL